MTSHAQKKSPSGPMRIVAAVTTFFKGRELEPEALQPAVDSRTLCFRKQEWIVVQPACGTIPASIGKTFVGKNVEFTVGTGFKTQESNEKIPYDHRYGLRLLERPATPEEIARLRNAIVQEGNSNPQIRAFVAEHWRAMKFPQNPFKVEEGTA